MNRIVCLAFLILFLLPPVQGNPSPADGDYTVNVGVVEVWENRTVNISGNLYVLGKLIIKNTTLNMQSFKVIRVQGWMEVEDLDGDPETEDDASVINGSPFPITTISTINFGYVNISNSVVRSSLIFAYFLNLESSRLTDTFVRMNSGNTLNNCIINATSTNNEYLITTNTASAITISNNIISNHTRAIRLQNGALFVVNCTLSNFDIGIFSDTNSRLYLRSTETNECNTVIEANGLVDLKDSLITNGTIKMKERSLLSDNTTFRDLKGINNIQTGQVINSLFINCTVALDSPKGVTVMRTRFVECSTAISFAVECLIFHNSFIDNDRDAEGTPDSIWYSSELKEGNYYTSYTGKDDGSYNRVKNDGVGDTDIPHLGRDSYPLLKDNYWEMPYIPELIAYNKHGTGNVNLSWTSDDSDGIFIQRSSNSNFSSGLRIWSVEDSRLSIENNPNSTLHFRISAYNENGFRGWSPPTTIKVDQVPLPPENIIVETLPEGGGLTISWEFRGEDIKNTHIDISTNDTKFAPRDLDYPEDKLTVPDLKNNIAYHITLRTEDGIGQLSRYSDNITGIPRDSIPPPPPRSPYAQPISNTSVKLTWNPPLIQDISGFLVYRREPGEEYELIANLSRGAHFHIDEGLEDNTTYEYAVSAIDDDGPVSAMAGPVSATTFHMNDPPEFYGSIGLIYMKEDNGSRSIALEGIAFDPNGDPLIISVEDFNPFRAEIIDDMLWILPEPDQSGDGYVKIKASDGESSSFLIMGIIIEGSEDPPVNVRIISPSNNSVLLPGRTYLFLADAEDPDQPYGDNLTYIWTSDRDGPLNGPGGSKENIRHGLSPGIHEITLEVRDTTGNSVKVRSRVLVSLWGWGEFPWGGKVISAEAYEEKGIITIRISNDGPVQLSFMISPADPMTSDLVGERGLLVSPSSTGDIDIDLSGPFEKDQEIGINLTIRAETLNGTFAGDISLNDTVIVKNGEKDDSRGMYILIMVLAISLIVMICLIIIFLVGKGTFSRSYRENLDEGVDAPHDKESDRNGR